MSSPVILWIRLTKNTDNSSITESLSSQCKLIVLRDIHNIRQQIHQHQPHAICFDFDQPDFNGLDTLRKTKKDFPSLPIIMLAEHNSEALVIWALRCRVWDYFTKPVNADELLYRFKVLTQFRENEQNRPLASAGRMQTREVAIHETPIPAQFRVCTQKTRTTTLPAIAYVESHFHEKILLDVIAEHCAMKTSAFSYAFKKNHNYTFREFLLRYRIRKATELLRHSEASVLEIACAVGFNDPSQFTRIFKRFLKTTPSAFRAENHPLPHLLPLNTEK